MSTTTTDPIADMLTRIRNAVLARKNNISLPHSNIKQAVAQLLKDAKFIDSVSVNKSGDFKTLDIKIYPEGSNPTITEINKLSRPGRRSYVNSKEIPVVKRGRGIVILTTSKGVMTGEMAKKQHVGGELICEVY